MPSRCSRLNQDYQELLTLQGQFSAELMQALATGDFTALALLKAEIVEKKQALESQINPFESSLKIREQYETQKAIYEKIGLLETREGMLGMEGIDGKWYAFPSLNEIHKRFRENKEMLDIKTDQGFTKLLIVPFGMSLAKFQKTMEKTLLAHYAEMPDPANPGAMIPDPKKTQLFATKKNAVDPDEPLRLDTANPLYLEEYIDADTTGALVYFPKVFVRDAEQHQGKTKKQLLTDTEQGFQILLIEKNPIIPAEDTDAIIGTTQPRKRLAAGDTAEAYLRTLQTKLEYSHEQGLTPEAWMTQFLLHLEETNQVIDDYRGNNGQVNLNLGGWFPAAGDVARGRWGRGGAQARLDRCGLGFRYSYNGSRSAVMI